MLLSHEIEPKVPTEARSRQIASAYAATVDALKRAGTRVVNMSWGTGPKMYEDALALHKVGARHPSCEGRKRCDCSIFEADALEAAIAHAPDILFVAAAGNGDNDADFQRYIPGGYSLPNLITVVAVDNAGAETSFSTFGKTVVVHANGFEVDSLLPGGQCMKLSGTSMASPQVANLAAKLLSLRPALTVANVKELILQAAERLDSGEGGHDRVNLVNPRRSAVLAGLHV
jgi:subtilisin family serine protease